MEVSSTYRAIQAVSQGRLELTEKTLQAPGPGKVRIRVEACGSATRIPAQWKLCFRSNGHASQAMRSSGGSMRLVPVSRAGWSVSAWVSGFSAGPAAIASSAATAIS